jgi:hypothetical protein
LRFFGYQINKSAALLFDFRLIIPQAVLFVMWGMIQFARFQQKKKKYCPGT